jgi:hypothetical protein
MSSTKSSAGKSKNKINIHSTVFRYLAKNKKPLQCVGTINAYTALMAEKSGHLAIYLVLVLFLKQIEWFWCRHCIPWSSRLGHYKFE